MTTKVRHYRNSFLDIENDKIRILMDPWVNTANEGSWAASKNGDKFVFKSIKDKNVDYIYISHLHTDHFDTKFLLQLKKKQKKKFKFLIKKFKDNRLKNILISNGFEKNDIIDLDEFQIYLLKDKSKFIILPQLSRSNTPNIYIKYDLDTSCVFVDKNLALYNQVDNPYSYSDIKYVMNKLKKKISLNFDLAFIPYCAASEFPQSFIDLNRSNEKKLIITNRIKKFLKIANLLKCKSLVPAGGSYELDNIFSKLNKYIAIPKFREIKKLFDKNNPKKIELIDTNKYFFEVKKKKVSLIKNNFSYNFLSKRNFNTKNISYNKLNYRFSKKMIKQTLINLENEMPEFKKNLYNKTSTQVKFKIWPNQPVLLKNLKREKSFIAHEINFNNKIKKTKLVIHMYYKLFFGIINNFVSWNEVQNHCLFERKPNKYDPDTIFWLNLYKF